MAAKRDFRWRRKMRASISLFRRCATTARTRRAPRCARLARHLYSGRRGAGGPEILPRLRLLRAGVPIWMPIHSSGQGSRGQVHALLPPHHQGADNRMLRDLPHGREATRRSKNPKDPIHEFLKTHPVQVLKPQMATGAKAYYNGLDGSVR